MSPLWLFFSCSSIRLWYFSITGVHIKKVLLKVFLIEKMNLSCKPFCMLSSSVKVTCQSQVNYPNVLTLINLKFSLTNIRKFYHLMTQLSRIEVKSLLPVISFLQ